MFLLRIYRAVGPTASAAATLHKTHGRALVNPFLFGHPAALALQCRLPLIEL